jgi:hypothetical protein
MQPKVTHEAQSTAHFLYWSSLSVCHSVGGKNPSKMVKNWILHHDTVPCQTPLQCSSFWWRTKLQQSSNYLIHQISLHATSVTSQGTKPDSTVIILYMQKKFNRILQHVSQPYQKMTSSDISSNGRTAGTRRMCRNEVLPGWLSYILYISI